MIINNVDHNHIIEFLYFRKVISIDRAIDGDTVILNCDQGKRNYDIQRYRLYGIDTPEKRKKTMAAYNAATEYLLSLLNKSKVLYVNTLKDSEDDFGRWLAILYDENGTCINQQMIDSGHAKPWIKK